MAQYYNFVTNASGTLTLEEVQRICSVEGQSVQLVVEDINNGGNGSQQFLAYTTAPQNSGQAIFSQQINLGSQISATQLDQGQNVFIIKTNTNELTSPQGVLKATTVNDNTVGGNIVNIVDNKGSKTFIGCNNDGQQIQWIKMQENSINVNAVSKQNALISEKIQTGNLNENQNNTSSQNLLHGLCELSSSNTEIVKRKPLKSYQNRNRLSTNSVQIGTSSIDRVNVTNNIGTQIPNANASIRASTPFCNKTVSPIGQNVTQISTQVHSPLSTVHSRPQAPTLPKSSLKVQQPKMEQTRLKQLQNQRQVQNDQRLQGNNMQRLSNIASQSVQSSLNNPRQQTTTNSVQQKQMSSSSQLQFQKQTTPQKSQYEQSPLSPPSQNVLNTMDVESLESSSLSEKDPINQQSFPSQTDSENGSTESIAYLEKVIHNPTNTKVQPQIQGNTAKMLVMLSNGEQRLITFDIPNEDCTVQDLLEQANIVFCGKTSVSLVSDPMLGINYIVEAGPGAVTSYDMSENDSSQDSANTNLDNSHSSPDENSNPVQQNEEPIYIEGMLAVCSHCGISSIDFNRCLRCKRKLPKDVKSISMTMGMQEKKETMLTIDTFYKKNNERNSSAKLEKLERDGSVYKRGRGRGRGGVSRPRPIHKEPECLTISSDEEEEGKIKRPDGSTNNIFSNDASNNFSEEMETILEKEPVITNNSISSISSDYAMESEDIKDNSLQSPHTSLLCRTVRIGSYKYVPRERVIISQTGVRFGVPLLEDDKTFVALEVKIQDIVKVLIHFGKAMPVLFFYTSTNTGAMIRELLGMQDPKGPYYDPAGKDHTHKRITLLPEKLSEESKVVLKSLFSRRRLLEELSSKEANDILVRASPKDLKIQSSSRKENQTGTTTNSNVNGGIQTITVYPPPPAKGGIAINTEDYLCLGEDQFLNDVIIDFYLKYLTLEVLSESDQHRTHVFSSYFYKRLTSPHAQAGESNVPLSPAAKRHARVQKWTKNVNIFEKDFIIIPINEHAHWFLAIICFPGLVGKVFAQPKRCDENDVHKTVQKSKKLKEVKLQAVTIGSTTLKPVTTTVTIDQGDDGSERDEAEGDDEEMEMDSEDDDESENAENKGLSSNVEPNIQQEKETIKVPCILIFDSLAGASRARVVATLRDYLSCEYVAKMGNEKVFSKDTIKGASLKVPQQSNFTDCGLYVLQYVESFFKNPIKDYTLPIKTLKHWFEEIVVTRKREELSKLLINLMIAGKGDKNITIPTVNFPTQDGKLKTKAENHVDIKSVKTDVEDKKKPILDGENRISNNMPNQTENTEPTTEVIGRTTYQIIPYSPCTSSSSSESNSTEMFTETKTPHPRSSSETMSYLKSKRISRLMIKTENQDDSQAAKKHKGESFDSCK
ncbi:sentrin-specific protease 7-like isoform X2 [Bombus pyrosoma]|uniref:sentrin-specific protease 7-like isoform X2 n=1 Tax=Bombus pyrosoma TaxID=396416 RepID=UPI001CB98580|nr:sentrin-specific protease 7-like isoform X2 [Bombus pyrosoma]